MEHLLIERPVPPYIISSLGMLLLVLVVPSLVYQYQNDIQPLDPKVAYAVVTSLAVTLGFFVLFVSILLRLLGVTAPVLKVLAATMYSLTPAIPLMIGYYIGNYFTIGHLTILTFLVTGRPAGGDWFLAFFPYFIKAAIFFSFLVFSQALRVLGKMGRLTGLMTALLALTLLIGAFFVGVTLSEAVFPNTSTFVVRFFSSLGNVPSAATHHGENYH